MFKWLGKLLAYTGTLVEERKLVRRLLVLSSMGLLYAISIRIFWGMPDFSDNHLSAFIAIISLFTTLIGLYGWQRYKELKNEDSK